MNLHSTSENWLFVKSVHVDTVGFTNAMDL